VGMRRKSFGKYESSLNESNRVPSPKGVSMMNQHDEWRCCFSGSEKIGTDTASHGIFQLGSGSITKDAIYQKDDDTRPHGPNRKSRKLFYFCDASPTLSQRRSRIEVRQRKIVGFA